MHDSKNVTCLASAMAWELISSAEVYTEGE
jgi:hypothetical protein